MAGNERNGCNGQPVHPPYPTPEHCLDRRGVKILAGVALRCLWFQNRRYDIYTVTLVRKIHVELL